MSIKKLFTDEITQLGDVLNKLAKNADPDADAIEKIVRAQIRLSTAIPFVDEPDQPWPEGESDDKQPDDLSPEEKKAKLEEQTKYQW